MAHLLNILVSLLLTFALFAFAVTAIVEAASSVLMLRSKKLASAMKELLVEASDPKRGTEIYAQLMRGSHIGGIKAGGHPSYINPQEFAKALNGVLFAVDSDKPLGALSDAIGTLPAGRLRTTLATLAADAEGDMLRFKANVATWFDTAMSRLSGEYKRLTQVLSFGIAIVLAMCVNADLVRITQYLAADPTRAAAVADSAEAVLAARGGGEAVAADDVAAKGTAAAEAQSALTALPYIGYACTDPADSFCPVETVMKRPLSLLGWLLMAITALAGAPFWFDVLQRFVNMRGTGPKPGTRTPGDGD